MKQPKDVADLGSQLTAASQAPLVPAAAVAVDRQTRATKPGSRSVFLRLPAELHTRLEAEAVARTKETGKGVTVQQVIVDRLARGEA